MPNAFLGHGSAVGIGQETAYGTKVTRAFWLRIVSWDMRRNITKTPRPHLGTTASVSLNRRQHYTEADDAGGSFEHLVAYDDASLVLLAHALGKVTTTGTGPYTHAITLAKQPATLNTDKVSLSLEGILGDSGDAEVFEGSMITRTTLSLSTGGVMSASHEVIAETTGGQEARSTPTFSSNGEEVLHSHGGTLAFNSNTHSVREISITVDQKLAKRQFIGSTLTQQPQPTDFTEVTVRFTREYTDDNPHDEYVADTQGDATIAFTGTGNNALTITMQNFYITSVTESVNTAGVITQTVEGRCESDGTDEGLSLAFVNDNASAFTN